MTHFNTNHLPIYLQLTHLEIFMVKKLMDYFDKEMMRGVILKIANVTLECGVKGTYQNTSRVLSLSIMTYP